VIDENWRSTGGPADARRARGARFRLAALPEVTASSRLSAARERL
jgi:hypothetical protein